MRALWAEHYEMPRTDPRYLDATEDDIYRDLLVFLYRSGERRRADPMAGQLEQVMRDPGKAAAEDAAFADQLRTGKMAERMAAFERARAQEAAGQGDGRRITRVRPPARPKVGRRKP